jgi:hypothetical protein
VVVDTRTVQPPFELPRVQWSDGINEHTLENPGPDDLIVIGVELKDEVEDDAQGAARRPGPTRGAEHLAENEVL